jgi:hypothetical protein
VKTLLLSTLLAILTTACVTDAADPILVSDEDDATDSNSTAAKSDSASEFHVVDVALRYSALKNEAFRVFTTRSSFATAFSFTGNLNVNFNTHWLFVYQAGTQPTGGYTADIVNITRTTSRIRFQTQLATPGASCVTTQGQTRPYVVVAFRKPTRPNATTFALSHSEIDEECAPTSCELVDCLPHLVCDDSSGYAECVPVSEPASCAAVLCLTNTYCDESTGSAQCLPLVCPRPGTGFNCKLPLTPDRGPPCNPSFRDWVGLNCPGVTFAL